MWALPTVISHVPHKVHYWQHSQNSKKWGDVEAWQNSLFFWNFLQTKNAHRYSICYTGTDRHPASLFLHWANKLTCLGLEITKCYNWTSSSSSPIPLAGQQLSIIVRLGITSSMNIYQYLPRLLCSDPCQCLHSGRGCQMLPALLPSP